MDSDGLQKSCEMKRFPSDVLCHDKCLPGDTTRKTWNLLPANDDSQTTFKVRRLNKFLLVRPFWISDSLISQHCPTLRDAVQCFVHALPHEVLGVVAQHLAHLGRAVSHWTGCPRAPWRTRRFAGRFFRFSICKLKPWIRV